MRTLRAAGTDRALGQTRLMERQHTARCRVARRGRAIEGGPGALARAGGHTTTCTEQRPSLSIRPEEKHVSGNRLHYSVRQTPPRVLAALVTSRAGVEIVRAGERRERCARLRGRDVY